MKTDYTFGNSIFMCTKCFGLRGIKFVITTFSSNDSDKQPRLNSLESIRCDECGEQVRFVRVDPLIAKAVSTLNKKGYFTSYHGQGFGYQETSKFRPPFISFKKSAKELFGSLPDGWEFDRGDDTTFIRGKIKGTWSKEKQVKLTENLTGWVEMLPDINQ